MGENYIRFNIVNTITVVLMVIIGMTVIRAGSSAFGKALGKGTTLS